MRKNVTMLAGKYVLGDPCYCFSSDDPDDLWMKLLESCDYFDKPIGEVNGVKILGFHTAYGDGTYAGSDGFDYGVDAGLIGLVPYDFAISQIGTFEPELHQVVEFDKDFECSEDNGFMVFGHITIETGYEESEEEDE